MVVCEEQGQHRNRQYLIVAPRTAIVLLHVLTAGWYQSLSTLRRMKLPTLIPVGVARAEAQMVKTEVTEEGNVRCNR